MAMYCDAFEDPDTYLARQPSDAYLAKLLGREDFIELIAEKDGAVVGALSAYVFHKFEQERAEVYIYDLAVAPAHQREGIGAALINALKPIARGLGVYLIIVQAEAGDEPAEGLYANFGKVLAVSSFDIDVGEGR